MTAPSTDELLRLLGHLPNDYTQHDAHGSTDEPTNRPLFCGAKRPYYYVGMRNGWVFGGEYLGHKKDDPNITYWRGGELSRPGEISTIYLNDRPVGEASQNHVTKPRDLLGVACDTLDMIDAKTLPVAAPGCGFIEWGMLRWMRDALDDAP